MKLGLKGKRVLVTGSSKGIGYAIAERFLLERAKVYITSRSKLNLLKSSEKIAALGLENNANFVKTDFRKSSSVDNLKKILMKNEKGLDILIVNIGDGSGSKRELIEEKYWNQSWDINFKTAINAVQKFLPLLNKSKGTILFISSIAGKETIGAPIAYATAKSALSTFSKNLSRINNNIRVNTIAPGNIYFEGGSWDKKIKKNKRKILDNIYKTVPAKRFGKPSEIASAAIFLCSDEAKFINGSTLVIDGGQTVSV